MKTFTMLTIENQITATQNIKTAESIQGLLMCSYQSVDTNKVGVYIILQGKFYAAKPDTIKNPLAAHLPCWVRSM